MFEVLFLPFCNQIYEGGKFPCLVAVQGLSMVDLAEFVSLCLFYSRNIVLPCRGGKDRDSTCGTTLSTGQL